MTPSDDPTGPPPGAREPLDSAGRGDAPSRHGRLGRRVALAVYAVGVTWVVGASFLSIPAQIFAPEGLRSEAPCPAQIRALGADLLDAATAAVDPRQAGSPPEPAFWRAWDARLAGARATCPAQEDTLAELRLFRYRLEGSLTRHERAAGPLARRLHGVLAPAEGGSMGDAAPTRP